MAARLKLHSKLCAILGSRNVYFQKPASLIMEYPAIRYSIKPSSPSYANNAIYRDMDCYEVILIDEDPDSEIFGKVKRLPYCKFDNFYTADNLNHWVFTLYH